ncbi:hypothetical protein C8J57DRAFT_1707022 [Mycena rebaudengoi]|nr:hypothetical protein C8J57DRAFT_1707022 [Mycena rebaudengoi]
MPDHPHNHADDYPLSPTLNRIIESNEIPSDMQAKDISESIKVAASLRLRLAAEIAAAQLHLLRLQRTDEDAKHHIDRCTAAIGPVRRLPSEILSQIFVFYRQDTFLDTNFVAHDHWKLGHICTYWRNVAVHTQELWSTFQHGCFCGTQSVEMASMWLKRAGSHPLTIIFDCANHCLSSHNGRRCSGIFAVLMSRSEHWKSARFIISGSELPAFESVRNRLPILEELDLRVERHEILEQSFDAFSLAPRLHTLRLRDVRTPMSLPWGQIMDYEGQLFDHTGTHILKLAPNILTLKFYDTRDTQYSEPIVHNLRHLHYRFGATALKSLVLPSLKSLRFCMQISGVDLASFTQSSWNTVTLLHIESVTAKHPRILLLFAATSSLTDLTIECHSDAEPDYIFGRLAASPTEDVPALLLLLRRLTVSSLRASESLLRLVQSRRVASAETARLESLTVRFGQGDAAYADRLRQLRGDGMQIFVGTRILSRDASHSSTWVAYWQK